VGAVELVLQYAGEPADNAEAVCTENSSSGVVVMKSAQDAK
jgi:hypothetical protein